MAEKLWVMRTARVEVRPSRASRERAFGLLRSAGDVRAWLLDMNRERRQAGEEPLVNYQALCRELTGHGRFGELSVQAARSVLKSYSAEWFEAARRHRQGLPAGWPRRKRGLVPVRYYHGTFTLTETTVRLSMAKGTAPLALVLTRAVPYPLGQVRSVKLVNEGSRLFVDVTARVRVQDHDLDPAVTLGVDLGVIHPYAAVVADVGLLISGRALRAEAFLHLEDSKARARKMAAKRAPRRARPGRPRQRGSRRWRKMHATGQRRQRRHLRTVRQAKHEAAKAVIALAVAQRAGRIAVGDPTGLCATDHGHVANKRNHDWRPGQSIRILADKAEVAGIIVERVDERGTSSHCPACRQRVPKPKGRTLCCPHCSFQGHRDLAGAHNIRARAIPLAAGNAAAGSPPATAITHRRAGTPPARRDRRRHLHDAARSSPAMGRPNRKGKGSRSPTSQTGTLDQPSSPAKLRSSHQPARNHQPTPTKQGKR